MEALAELMAGIPCRPAAASTRRRRRFSWNPARFLRRSQGTQADDGVLAGEHQTEESDGGLDVQPTYVDGTTQELESMYLEYYGLSELPFNITPDPRFLYYSPRHREAFDHLSYGIATRKGFIELTGEVGSGKTTLCRAVLSQLTETVRTALILNPCLSEDQLLRAILVDFGLEVNGGDRLDYVEQLNRFLLAQAREGNNVVLIIDEAQNLLPGVLEQIRLLSNLETDQHKLMQIVLAGQPELRERLARPDLRQLRQRILVRCHLHPLNEEETGEYIRHRLHVAGGNAHLRFNPKAVRLVYRHSHGIPRIINALCDNALLAGYVSRTHEIGVAEIKRALKEVESTS